METLAVAIKTAKRADGEDYLQATLAGLRESCGAFRFYQIWVSHTEGPLERLDPETFGEVQRLNEPGPLTLHQNAARAIRTAAGAGADWTLVLEDDLAFCNDFAGSVLRWLQKHERRDRRMYVFGANYAQILVCQRARQSCWDYPVGAFYGAQAIAWRTADAAALAKWLGPDPSYDGVRDHGHDLLLQRWGRFCGLRHFLASVPSFVQHVGKHSGIGNRFFAFASWPGPDWVYRGARAA